MIAGDGPVKEASGHTDDAIAFVVVPLGAHRRRFRSQSIRFSAVLDLRTPVSHHSGRWTEWGLRRVSGLGSVAARTTA